MTRRRLAALLWVALAASVSGCATSPPAGELGGPALNGRIALIVDAAPPLPARRFSADFDLRGDATRGTLELSGPLGTMVARARWQPGSAELQTSDGVQAYAGLDELAGRAFGEPLPLAALFDWLRGRPWTGAGHRDRAGGFEQLGWIVDVSRHADGVVEARRSTPPEVQLRVRLL